MNSRCMLWGIMICVCYCELLIYHVCCLYINVKLFDVILDDWTTVEYIVDIVIAIVINNFA